MEQQTGHKTQTTILVIFSVIVLAGVGYLFYQAQQSPEATTSLNYGDNYGTTAASPTSRETSYVSTTPSESTGFDAELKAIDTDLNTVDSDAKNADTGLNDQQTDLSS